MFVLHEVATGQLGIIFPATRRSEFWIENHVAEKAVRPTGALLELGVVRSEGLLIFNLIAPSFSDLGSKKILLFL